MSAKTVIPARELFQTQRGETKGRLDTSMRKLLTFQISPV